MTSSIEPGENGAAAVARNSRVVNIQLRELSFGHAVARRNDSTHAMVDGALDAEVVGTAAPVLQGGSTEGTEGEDGVITPGLCAELRARPQRVELRRVGAERPQANLGKERRSVGGKRSRQEAGQRTLPP